MYGGGTLFDADSSVERHAKGFSGDYQDDLIFEALRSGSGAFGVTLSPLSEDCSTAPVDEQALAAAAARQPWWLRVRRFQFRQVDSVEENVFADLLDSLILDVASEAHRAARLGFDYRLRNEEDEARTCASARATLGDVDSATSENSGKYTVDVFEQTHPTIAQEMFDCMNCGRPIVAGRFAPHLEKCMGKGRKARLKPNSSASAVQPRRGRAAVPASRNTNENAANHNRPSSRPPVPAAAQESQRSAPEVNGMSTTVPPEADKDEVRGPSHLGKTRTKKSSLKVQRVNPGGSVAPIPFGSGVLGRGVSAPDTTLGSLSGFVSGMAVPVAVELETPVAKHNPTGSARTSTVKGRTVTEKKRKIGQVLAGSASVGNGASENGEVDARSRAVEVRIENSDTSLMPPFSSSSWG